MMIASDSPQRRYSVQLNGTTWAGEMFVPVHVSGVLICLGEDCSAQISTDAFQKLHLATLPLHLPATEIDSEASDLKAVIDWVRQHAVTRRRPIIIFASGSALHANAALSATLQEPGDVASVILYRTNLDDASLKLLPKIECPVLWIVEQARQDLAAPNLEIWEAGAKFSSERLASWIAELVQPSDVDKNPL
jgi:hypothetical protein